MDMINVKIDGRDYQVPAGSTVLEACKYAGINIPTLCYLKDINEIGACRLCLVEVKGARGLVTSCVYPCNEGIEILTNTPRVKQARKLNIELVLTRRSASPAYAPPPVSFRTTQTSSAQMQDISQARMKIIRLTPLPRSSFATTTSVSFAAAALQPAPTCRESALSA